MLHSYDSLDMPNDFFGNSVAISDSYAMIGAPGFNSGFEQGVGYAAVIDLQSGEVIHTLRSDTDAPFFGTSVAISGSLGIVGQIPFAGLAGR